jgi:putative transposase
MLPERRIAVDHSTVYRWAIKLLPVLEKPFRCCKRVTGKSRRMDETYVKIRQIKYLNNVVEQNHRAIKTHHPTNAWVQGLPLRVSF